MIWGDDGLTLVFGDSHFQLSQPAVLAVLIAVACLLVLAFLYLQFFAPRCGQPCRWKRIRDHRKRPPFKKWRCKTCLAEAYSSDRRPPKECKKALKSGL
jgi:hypothetical protein